jgi:hypothetical protein
MSSQASGEYLKPPDGVTMLPRRHCRIDSQAGLSSSGAKKQGSQAWLAPGKDLSKRKAHAKDLVHTTI